MGAKLKEGDFLAPDLTRECGMAQNDGDRVEVGGLSEALELIARAGRIIDEAKRIVGPGQAKDVTVSSVFRFRNTSFRDWLSRSMMERSWRKKFFNPDYFSGEPAWDILLDLAIARLDNKKISVPSACIASGVPATTALRWIAMLEADGQVSRENDYSDRRKVYLSITDGGMKTLYGYFLKIIDQSE